MSDKANPLDLTKENVKLLCLYIFFFKTTLFKFCDQTLQILKILFYVCLEFEFEFEFEFENVSICKVSNI